MEIVETVRVTKKFGRTLENLEMLWFLRDQASLRLTRHIQGIDLDADEWAAVNTPDEAWTTVAEGYIPPSAEWKKIKDEWFEESGILAELAMIARRNVRIATGHEPIGKLICV